MGTVAGGVSSAGVERPLLAFDLEFLIAAETDAFEGGLRLLPPLAMV